LVTLVWYPTDATSPVETLSIGPPSTPLFLAGVAIPDAPVAQDRARYPLVVLSHGTGGSAVQLAWLGLTLARRGYIVAAVNHHGNTATEAHYDARGFLLWWERARDVSVAIDRLLDDPLFGTRIDTSRIATAGFSLGGYTVLELAGARTDLQLYDAFCTSAERDFTCEPQPEMPSAHEEFARLRMNDAETARSLAHAGDSYRDERIRAVAALAPAVGRALTSVSLGQIRVPVLLVKGDSDRIAPAPTNADYIHAQIRNSQLVGWRSVGHYTFLSACTDDGRMQLPALCGELPGVNREAIHDEVAEAVRTFFDRTLGVARRPTSP
jgi:predicted dienelactone hydrolase